MSTSKRKPTWREIPFAGIIFEPGTSTQYKTGEWRNLRPIINAKACTKCSMCWVYCPDAAIKLHDDGMPEIDLNYCKGCGICASECAPKAIVMVEEGE